jgi:P-type Ca2+ transporter type 2C
MPPPFSLSKEKLFEELKTSDSGLSSAEVKLRLEKYGPNRLTEKKKVSPLSIFISQFKNTLTLILLGSVGLVLFIYFFGDHDQSDLIEAGLILAIVIMIAVLGFAQEYKAEKALESLKKLLKEVACV